MTICLSVCLLVDLPKKHLMMGLGLTQIPLHFESDLGHKEK